MNIKKKNVESIVLKIIATALMFYLHTIVSKQFGSEGYGVFSFALLISIILSEIATLGWSRSITRFLVEAKNNNDTNEYCHITKKAHITTISLSFLLFCFCSVVYFFQRTKDIGSAIIPGGILIIFLALNAIRRKIFMINGNIRLAIIPVDIAIPSILIIILIVFKIENISQLFVSLVFAHAIVFIIASGTLWKELPCAQFTTKTTTSNLNYTNISLIVLIGIIGQMLISRVDLLIVGFVMESSELGLYSAATKIARLNPFFLGVITLLFAPLLASAYHKKDLKQFKRLLLSSILLSIILSTPVFIFSLISPEFILSLFGKEFTQANTVLIILSVGQFINAITGPVASTLLVTGQENKYAITLLGFSILSFAMNLFTVNLYGLIGAAFATSISVGLLNITQLYIVWKHVFKTKV